MCRDIFILCLLHFFGFTESQVTEKQTTSDHVTQRMPSETMGDKVTTLEVMVKYLQLQIEDLQNQRKSEKAHYTELEKRMSLSSTESVTLHSDLMQIMQTQTEFQTKLTQIDETVGDLKLEMTQFNFIQKQLQADIGNWQDLKDQTRKQHRRIEKRLIAKIENVEANADELSKVLSETKINCSTNLKKVENTLAKLENLIQNNSYTLQKFIENQTEFHSNMGKMSIEQRFEKLYKLYNVSRPKPDSSKIFYSSESSKGLESEFIMSNSEENKLWNEAGSGEEGSGETIPVLSQHSHKNYVQKQDLLLELQERDLEINTLLDVYENLKTGLSTLEGRLQEIRLGNFMERLQDSFINFTQNVLTMEQWRMASGQIINSTQFNQQQIAGLTNMIFNNTNFLRELEMKISNAQSLSYQQFSLLRIHIIQLNNTVQDMKEEWNRNRGNQKTQKLPPPVYVHTIQNGHPNLDPIQSRLEDIALQVVYNENRIAKMELKILNESLLECKKVNADFYQDARILQIESSVIKMSEASQMVKNILNQVQRELYQEYLVNKNQSEVINVIIQDLGKVDQVFPLVANVQQQLGYLQYMLPEDCYGYYRRGFKDSGIYIINPNETNLTLQVYCDLEDGDTGWTVIQKRSDGSEDFDRSWLEYKNGFGDVFGEFWIGNDLINLLTTSNSSLKIEMTDVNDKYWSVTYDHFAVADGSENYKLSVSGFHGNSSDSLTYSNDMGFSTNDRDNDASSTHCAMYYTAGWWYKHCHYSNLNGRFRLGMVWYDFNEDKWIQLKSSVMKIKPNI